MNSLKHYTLAGTEPGSAVPLVDVVSTAPRRHAKALHFYDDARHMYIHMYICRYVHMTYVQTFAHSGILNV
jgi:hypothetical protein